MNPLIYSQLATLSEFLKINHRQVTIPAGQSGQLADNAPQRIYIAFTYLSSTSPITYAPYLPSNSSDGYITQGNPSIQEFYMEHHYSLMSQKWFAFNGGAGPITITVIEVMYGVPQND